MPLMSFLFNRKECILLILKVHHYIKYEQDHLFSYCIGLVVMTSPHTYSFGTYYIEHCTFTIVVSSTSNIV